MRGLAEDLSKSLSRSRDVVDHNEVVLLGVGAEGMGQDRLSPLQAGLNLGIFDDFAAKVATSSQNGNNSLVQLSSEQDPTWWDARRAVQQAGQELRF